MTEYAEYEFRMSREFSRNVLDTRSPLETHEQDLCIRAVYKFRANHRQPGLHFESLGGDKDRNLYSIRGDKELRVILAIDNERQICVLANAGHHDDMYEGWVEPRGGYYDPDDAVRMYSSVREARSLDDLRTVLEKAWTSDFDQWSVFLHPDEERLVKARWQGTARIRGPAGTGKTVVALHRAAALAERYPDQPILLTAPHRTLCTRLQRLYTRMPQARDNVEFVHIDDLALALCGGIAAGRWDDQGQIDAAFEAAYQRVVMGTPLAQLGRSYLREEIEILIKGRGVERAAVYLDTDSFERLGRKCSFPLAIRAQVWALYEAWNREMQVRHTVHRWDNTCLGRNNAHRLSKGIYRCALVNESQDMSLVSMQLVRALVAGAPENEVPEDGIVLLDDAAQQYYAGGFRPSWAQLNVKGRSFTLNLNYRNVKPILAAARQVRGNDLLVPEDSEDDVATCNYLQDGHMPWLVRVADATGENLFIRDEIQKLTQDGGYEPGEIGVLVRDSQEAADLMAYLRDEGGFACAWLGQTIRQDTMQVGTFGTCKGFEFRAVFIPRLARAYFPQLPPDVCAQDIGSGGKGQIGTRERQAVEQETRQLELDQLYAAMTRAREYLVLIVDGDPCEEIQAARHCFDYKDQSPMYPGTPQ